MTPRKQKPPVRDGADRDLFRRFMGHIPVTWAIDDVLKGLAAAEDWRLVVRDWLAHEQRHRLGS